MNFELIEVPSVHTGAAERSSVTALHFQQDGSLLCGLSFSNPIALRLTPKIAGGKTVFDVVDLELEDTFGSDLYLVSQGLRGTTSGDTAFAVLHGGMLPGFVRSLMGQELSKKSGPELIQFLFSNSGGMGGFVRHSILQLLSGELSARRMKEPGAVLDVAHIGDYIFGLTGSSIWREPYLNSEKRETLRNDLQGNASLHRDESSMFWFLGANGRFLRMGQTDIKAVPTPLKWPGNLAANPVFRQSTEGAFDSWLYGIADEANTLFRVRKTRSALKKKFKS